MSKILYHFSIVSRGLFIFVAFSFIYTGIHCILKLSVPTLVAGILSIILGALIMTITGSTIVKSAGRRKDTKKSGLNTGILWISGFVTFFLSGSIFTNTILKNCPDAETFLQESLYVSEYNVKLIESLPFFISYDGLLSCQLMYQVEKLENDNTLFSIDKDKRIAELDDSFALARKNYTVMAIVSSMVLLITSIGRAYNYRDAYVSVVLKKENQNVNVDDN